MSDVCRRPAGSESSRPVSRRFFLGTALAVTATTWAPPRAKARSLRANEKLNIGVVGTANRGAANINGVQSENIVAICDVDSRYLAQAQERFPKAKAYRDFRKLLEQHDLDAIVVSTTDHTHASPSAIALNLGKHVYCEKPLTHSVHEARTLATLAKAHPELATQMGTQIHAGANYRRVVELIRAGAIGTIKEVHTWVAKSWGGDHRPQGEAVVPDYLDWDLWLGPAPQTAFNPGYHPAEWRRYWAFGNGSLGDMGCHHIDLPFWALDLTAPTTITADGPPVDPEVAPNHLQVRYEFPAVGDRPALSLTWYDGGLRPALLKQPGMPRWGDGNLFVGDKGMLLADYSDHRLLPEADFREFQPPEPTIPDSIGHYDEWIEACKTGRPTTCNFVYSGNLTETVLLGTVAYRCGQTLEWDPIGLRAPNCSKAEEFLRRDYRAGWTLG